ncbi:hypothetical protein CCASEI_14333 (plasmid) [Corynebacterium casei LMG S-19264]|uniref:Uncharacterized protein n=1 Tax=Corynebacterium casei LMG S-19264 TaxID=1285583 RepID=A0ABN4CKU8_9CORY|nr:hypothetical protein CCASEI_14333 [Corynebacterium casei LMG S-19264]
MPTAGGVLLQPKFGEPTTGTKEPVHGSVFYDAAIFDEQHTIRLSNARESMSDNHTGARCWIVGEGGGNGRPHQRSNTDLRFLRNENPQTQNPLVHWH